MATFDPQAILDAVDSGSGNEPWMFYRARKAYFLDQGYVIGSQALLMCFCASVFVAVSIGLYFGGPPDIETRIYAFFFLAAALICGVIAVLLGWRVIGFWRQMRTARMQMVVLTPEGFVARVGPQPQRLLPEFSIAPPAMEGSGTSNTRIYSVSYDQLWAISRIVEPSLLTKRIKLNLTFKRPHEPRTVQWFIDPRFGPVDAIAQSIIGGHARYAAQHASMP